MPKQPKQLRAKTYWKNYLILGSLFLPTFCWIIGLSPARATIAPQVYLSDLKIFSDNLRTEETIQGSVSLWNYENFALGDLVFHFQLLSNEVNGVATQQLDRQISQEIFGLAAGEKTSRTFTYSVPKNLPNGIAIFRIQLANVRGEQMGWTEKTISISSENKFLILDNYWILKDGESLSPGGGITYLAGEVPTVSFDIKNNSNFSISAFIQITTNKRNVDQVIANEKKEDIILQPGEIKTQQALLPQLTAPGSYLSEVKLYDNVDQQPISNSIYFRWLISSQDDAEILFVQPDKEVYQAGEEAKIKVQFVGPADFDAAGGTSVLRIKLINQKEEVIGEAEKEIDLRIGQETFNVFGIPIKENVSNLKIETQIIKGEKILAEYTLPGTPLAEKEKQKTLTNFWKNNKKAFLILVFVIILIVAVIIYFFYPKNNKNGKLPKSLIFLILFAAGIYWTGNSAQAAIEVADSPDDTMVVFNSPPPDQTYNAGDTVNFSGRFSAAIADNGLFFNKIEFFIAEDREIPLRTNDCCSNCCGNSSTNYGCGHFGYCDMVLTLDTLAGYKIRRLGTIYPPDSVNYLVEYNQSFTIPADLDFSGPVRFYVQYSGVHRCWPHWHWNITYQPGIVNINHPPSAVNLSVAGPDYCQSGPSAVFNWNFIDPGDNQSAYQIQVDNDSNFSSPEIDSNKINSSSNAYTVNLGLSYNTSYHWRLKVWDGQNTASNWISGISFATPKHAYPLINFQWLPDRPSVNELVQFVDQTTVFGGATKSSWSWTFPDGNPPTSSQQDPVIAFLSVGSKNITLRVTDSDGYSCVLQLPTPDIQQALPKWKEVPP